MLNVSIDGIEDLRKRLAYIDLQKIESQRIKKSTIILQREARVEAPVDLGNLRNKIEYENYTHVGYVRSLAPYSTYVHDGTKYIKKPNPYMTRAKEKNEDDIIQTYRNDLAEHISRLGLNK